MDHDLWASATNILIGWMALACFFGFARAITQGSGKIRSGRRQGRGLKELFHGELHNGRQRAQLDVVNGLSIEVGPDKLDIRKKAKYIDQ